MFVCFSPCNSTTSLLVCSVLLVCSLSGLLACSAMMRRPVRSLHAHLSTGVHPALFCIPELCNSARICVRDAAPAFSLLPTLLACLLAPTCSLFARLQLLAGIVETLRMCSLRAVQLCSHVYILTLCHDLCSLFALHLCAHRRRFMF
jgi:hypothetical protein